MNKQKVLKKYLGIFPAWFDLRKKTILEDNIDINQWEININYIIYKYGSIDKREIIAYKNKNFDIDFLEKNVSSGIKNLGMNLPQSLYNDQDRNWFLAAYPDVIDYFYPSPNYGEDDYEESMLKIEEHYKALDNVFEELEEYIYSTAGNQTLYLIRLKDFYKYKLMKKFELKIENEKLFVSNNQNNNSNTILKNKKIIIISTIMILTSVVLNIASIKLFYSKFNIIETIGYLIGKLGIDLLTVTFISVLSYFFIFKKKKYSGLITFSSLLLIFSIYTSIPKIYNYSETKKTVNNVTKISKSLINGENITEENFKKQYPKEIAPFMNLFKEYTLFIQDMYNDMNVEIIGLKLNNILDEKNLLNENQIKISINKIKVAELIIGKYEKKIITSQEDFKKKLLNSNITSNLKNAAIAGFNKNLVT